MVEEAFDYLDAPIIRVVGRNTAIPFSLNWEQVRVTSVEDGVECVTHVVEL